MALTQTEREFYHYCDNNEFIPDEIIADFTGRLEQEDDLIALSVGLEKFHRTSCPGCNANGAFKWHFLGKLSHPDCGWSWYASSWEYQKRQLGSVFRTGMEIATETYSDAEREGQKGAGCFGAIFGFFIGLFFRLPFAILMSIIQAPISWTQKRPEPKTQTN